MVGEKDLQKRFGEALRAERLRAGLTQEQLGLEAGLQRKYISLLELGSSQPTLVSLFRLATALGIKASLLVGAIERDC